MPESNIPTGLFREMGVIGLNYQGGWLREDFIVNLSGVQGVKTYTEMSYNSAILGAILFIIDQMVQQVEWKVKPFSNEDRDKESAEFIQSCFDDMSQSWSDTISEILTFLPYGWAWMEVCYKQRLGPNNDPSSKFNDRKVGWRKWALRGQNTLYKWDIDESGGIDAMIQQTTVPSFQEIRIPIEKSLLFRTRVEKNNPEGFSVFRRAYRAYWYTKRMEEIEAIGAERDLAGLPVLKPPPLVNLWDPNDSNATDALRRATQLVTKIRRGENEGIVIPDGWTLELLTSGSRRQFDLNAIIERYEKRQAMTCAADFLFLGMGATGSYALSSDKTELFTLALGGYLKRISDVIDRHAIPPLLKLNGFDIERPPTWEHSDLETPDLQRLATYLTVLTDAGAVTFPDKALEDYLRLIAGLPPQSEEDLPEEETIVPEEEVVPEENSARSNGNRAGA